MFLGNDFGSVYVKSASVLPSGDLEKSLLMGLERHVIETEGNLLEEFGFNIEELRDHSEEGKSGLFGGTEIQSV